KGTEAPVLAGDEAPPYAARFGWFPVRSWLPLKLPQRCSLRQREISDRQRLKTFRQKRPGLHAITAAAADQPQPPCAGYCRSYSPLLTRFNTVNPAFFASEIERLFGELKADQAFRTGFLQAGQ